jgi:hypothetical protein
LHTGIGYVKEVVLNSRGEDVIYGSVDAVPALSIARCAQVSIISVVCKYCARAVCEAMMDSTFSVIPGMESEEYIVV